MSALVFLGLVFSIAAALIGVHERGYKRGYHAGFGEGHAKGEEWGEKRGREKEREWIIAQAKEVEQAREQIWREEAS